ncbi:MULTISPECIES: hypothetical protein [Haloarcula]|uniref:Uncharacterized protein n=3 Tax=Haloarcula TaxID=2237 RepID=A0A830EUK2_9EURY|nr:MULTISPECIES: hypothetical protein [Haloarcula]NLV12976.1 hypothetical protein [Haloarcula argentinensis]GGK59162.1 hypothetical protein GCM10009067_09590 [Haloarcula sebkhae]
MEKYDNESMSPHEQRGRKKPAYRWHMYHTLIVWVVAPVAGLIVKLGGLKLPVLREATIIFLLTVSFAALLTAIGSIKAFYDDAQSLKGANAYYQPLWPLWVIGSVIISTVFTAPLYLILRRVRMGPADYSQTYLTKVFEE